MLAKLLVLFVVFFALESYSYDIKNREYAARLAAGWVSGGAEDVSGESIRGVLNFVDETDVSNSFIAVSEVNEFLKNNGFFKLFDTQESETIILRGLGKFINVAEKFDVATILETKQGLDYDEREQALYDTTGVRMLVLDVVNGILSSYKNSALGSNAGLKQFRQAWDNFVLKKQ